MQSNNHEQSVYTLVNPQNGHLAFKIFGIDGHHYFDHVQRLNYYSIVIIKEGSGTLKVDFSTYAFEQNTMMFFSPYQPFMFSKAQGLKGLVIHFHPDFFCIHKHHHEVSCNGVLFNNIYNPPTIYLSEADIVLFDSLIAQMKNEMRNTEIAQYELLVSFLKIMLINASRIKISQFPEITIAQADKQEPFVLQSFKDAIETNFKNKHTASDYAEMLNISPKALAKIIKTHFNKTITDLIAERIVIEAKRELYLTAKPVKEIAYQLGFDDEHYFSRFFKKNADVSPQLYRESVGFARGSVV